MGKIIQLYPPQKRLKKPKKWSILAFEERARQAQKSVDHTCWILENEAKILQRRKLITYEQGIDILQTVRTLHQHTDTWFIAMHDNEHLPFLVYTHRLPLLSACFQVKQHSGEVIKMLVKLCTTNITEPVSAKEVSTQLAILLKGWKVFSYEMEELLNLIHLRNKQKSIG